MFFSALFSKSVVALYLYGKFGQSLLQARLQTSSCRHSSKVTAARNFLVGSSISFIAAFNMAVPNAPIPDFSNNASLAIQYAWATRFFTSRPVGSSESQDSVTGFQS